VEEIDFSYGCCTDQANLNTGYWPNLNPNIFFLKTKTEFLKKKSLF